MDQSINHIFAQGSYLFLAGLIVAALFFARTGLQELTRSVLEGLLYLALAVFFFCMHRFRATAFEQEFWYKTAPQTTKALLKRDGPSFLVNSFRAVKSVLGWRDAPTCASFGLAMRASETFRWRCSEARFSRWLSARRSRPSIRLTPSRKHSSGINRSRRHTNWRSSWPLLSFVSLPPRAVRIVRRDGQNLPTSRRLLSRYDSEISESLLTSALSRL